MRLRSRARQEVRQALPAVPRRVRMVARHLSLAGLAGAVRRAHGGRLVSPVAPRVAEVVAVEAKPDTYRLLMADLASDHTADVAVHRSAAGVDCDMLAGVVLRQPPRLAGDGYSLEGETARAELRRMFDDEDSCPVRFSRPD